jgi:hypothetical protein
MPRERPCGDTTARLKDAGWTVIRVWEHEDSAGAAERLATVLTAGRPLPSPSALARASAGGCRHTPAQVLHIWDIAAGLVKRDRCYADTRALNIALHGGAAAGVRWVPSR